MAFQNSPGYRDGEHGSGCQRPGEGSVSRRQGSSGMGDDFEG